METFEQFATRWKETILPLKKPASQVTMASHIKLLNQAFGGQEIAGLCYPEVQRAFSNWSKTLAPKSVKNLHGTYRNIMGQAKREELVTEFPKPVLPKLTRIQQDWLTLDQMQRLIACSDVNKAFVALLCETGLRIGEAVGLQTKDINFNERILSVNRSVFRGLSGSPKTASAFRSMYISERLAALLRGQSDLGSEAYVFRTATGRPAWPGELRERHLDPLARTLGIKPVGYHAYRRGCASVYASVIGMPERILAHRMGHSAQGLTLSVYAQVIDNADVPYVDQAAKLLYGEGK